MWYYDFRGGNDRMQCKFLLEDCNYRLEVSTFLPQGLKSSELGSADVYSMATSNVLY